MSSSFIFERIDNNLKNGSVSFSYSLSLASGTHSFIETLTLPRPVTREVPVPVLSQILQMLHILLGISYWKTFCPKNIEIKGQCLSRVQSDFWNTVYTQGLGEFYFTNTIDFRGLVSFPFEKSSLCIPTNVTQQSRSLVGLGGGKDSLVVTWLMQKHKKIFDTFIVETQHSYPFIDKLNTKLGKTPLIVKRSIDPKLIKLNRQSTTHNGHIPISAIYGAIGILLAVAYDYSSVIMGNERSSDVGNTIFHGTVINHQWSKSKAFEILFQQFIHDTISPQLTYCSLLRPLSEMQVMKLFTRQLAYLPLFSSCNRNFSITRQLTNATWCGKCPKCAFAFALLSAFVSKKTIVSLFGVNLFAQKSLLPIYQQLWGEKGIKPFECVGTPQEVKLAFAQAYKNGEYQPDIIMKYYVKHILSTINILELEQKVMNPSALDEVEKIISSV